MEENNDQHPNWVALATVKFRPKIFIKSSGTEDVVEQKDKEDARKIQIDEAASKVYNEILQMPSTSQAKPKVRPARQKRRIKIEKTKFNKQDFFKLAMANDSDGIQKLINSSEDVDINATDAFGWTALMMAACEGALESFQTLLELGADVSIAARGQTSIDIARAKGFHGIIETYEELKKQCESVDMTEDDDTQQSQEGTLVCSDCGIEFSVSSSTSHQTSIVHLFSCKFKGNSNIKSFGIARSNRGFQIMKRTGWDGQSGLGARQNGKLYPIRTVIRKQRTGLGIKQDSSKVTHFHAYDTRGVHFKPQPRALTRREILENDARDKRRDQRLRKELS
jgi:hypothetical protein